MNNDAWLLFGLLSGAALPLAALWLWHALTFGIYPDESLLVLRFGRLARRVDEPGLHVLIDGFAPWTRTLRVSRRIQATLLRDIEVHDVGGTELGVDVFVEFQVVDPVKATFAIENLSESVIKLVSHAVITVLGARTFDEILRDSGSLSEGVQAEIRSEAAAWGVEVRKVLLQQMRPSSMATEQILAEVAARLEKMKARIEEEGRQAVALLHARTAAEIAVRIAKARGQYPRAIGKAYAAMREGVTVDREYRELHDLVLLRPAHTVAFVGFEPGELRASDAAMFDLTAATQKPAP